MGKEKDRRGPGRSRKDGEQNNTEPQDQRRWGPETKAGTSLSLKTILIQTLYDKHPNISPHRLSSMTVDELLADVILEFNGGGATFRPRITFLTDAYTRRVLGFYLHPYSPEEHG